ncbi:caspase family protein [Zavarzinia sp. CC-PAN008]|uniref:caspase family protein n=1 Tax=Zavarzinia sp. CC-PAN008 TaxID=3243332 RepID=UPI003F747A50
MRRWLVAWGVVLALALGILGPHGVAQAAEKRVALVLGNAAYGQAPLANPVNDAKAMAAALERLGFVVILRTDATQLEMRRALRAFAQEIQAGGTAAVIYYAGHGVQYGGQNYLMPVDARVETEGDIPLEGLGMDVVLDQLVQAGSPVNVIVLDACRNNPFERGPGAVTRSMAPEPIRGYGQERGLGLAQITAPRGTLIAYATAPGSTAADGTGEHSHYTGALLEVIETPGLKVEDLFKQVLVKVAEATANAQTPWISSSLSGDFYFAPAVAPDVFGPPLPPMAGGAGPGPSVDREALFWQSVAQSQDPAELRAYLDRFPDGTFTPLARARLQKLEQEQVAALNPPPAAADVASLDRTLDATVLVMVDSGGTTRYGSGVVVAPGVVATAGYVIDDAQPDGITIASVRLGHGVPASLLHRQEGQDGLALLQVSGIDAIRPAVLDDGTTIGPDLVAAGFDVEVQALDAKFAAQVRRVDSGARLPRPVRFGGTLRAAEAQRGLIAHTGAPPPGSGGGPVMDRCGRLAGVTLFVARSQVGPVSYAAPSRALARLLSDNGIGVLTATAPCEG